MVLGLCIACVDVYRPRYAGNAKDRCGDSPARPNTIGYVARQDDWNLCAREADRAFNDVQLANAKARRDQEKREREQIAAEERAKYAAAAAEEAHRVEEQKAAEEQQRRDKIARFKRHQAAVQNAHVEWDRRVANARELVQAHSGPDELAAWDQEQAAVWASYEQSFNEAFSGRGMSDYALPQPALPPNVSDALAAADREQEAEAAKRRAFADNFDAMLVDRGQPGDAAETEGDHDTVLVFRTFDCSRQRVHKLLKGSPRTRLKSLGFLQFACDNGVERAWEDIAAPTDVGPVERLPAAKAQPVDSAAGSALLCCDGSQSLSCSCGGSHRGCCSHHGGVCGCAQ
jgi:hypothetical protein